MLWIYSDMYSEFICSFLFHAQWNKIYVDKSIGLSSYLHSVPIFVKQLSTMKIYILTVDTIKSSKSISIIISFWTISHSRRIVTELCEGSIIFLKIVLKYRKSVSRRIIFTLLLWRQKNEWTYAQEMNKNHRSNWFDWNIWARTQFSLFSVTEFGMVYWTMNVLEQYECSSFTSFEIIAVFLGDIKERKLCYLYKISKVRHVQC